MLTLTHLAIALASAQAVPGCTDDRGVNRCNEPRQGDMRAFYGLDPIERHAAAGDQVRRAMFVDGYGADVVAISFVRPRGGDPYLRIDAPRSPGNSTGPLTAAVPLARWRDVLQASRHFDRKLQPLANNELQSICMHSWMYVVEASDVVRDAQPANPVRRATQDACEGGLTYGFAVQLSRMAVPLLPACDLLDRSLHRTEAALLGFCAGRLSGDRYAAASAANGVLRLSSLRGDGGKDVAAELFDSDATLDRNGQRTTGWAEVGAAWNSMLKEAGASFWPKTMTGAALDEVRVTGAIQRSVPLGQDKYRAEEADVQQVWTDRYGDNAFRLRSAIVGPFRPVQPPR